MVGEIFNRGKRTSSLIFPLFFYTATGATSGVWVHNQFYLSCYMRPGWIRAAAFCMTSYPPQSHAAPCRHSAPSPAPSTLSSPPKKERRGKKEKEKGRKEKRERKGKIKERVYSYVAPGPPPHPSAATGSSTPLPSCLNSSVPLHTE